MIFTTDIDGPQVTHPHELTDLTLLNSVTQGSCFVLLVFSQMVLLTVRIPIAALTLLAAIVSTVESLQIRWTSYSANNLRVLVLRSMIE